MNRFLKLTAWFALLALMAIGLLEWGVRQLPTVYSYKNAWMERHGEGVNTLILGSSHTYFGIKPELLGDSVFNLANASQTLEYDLALLERYEPVLKNLKRVIVPISYFTFNEPLLEDLAPRHCVSYKVEMHLNVHPFLSKYNLAISDYSGFRGKIKNIFSPQEHNECDSLGFGLGFTLSHRDAAWESKGRFRAGEVTHPSATRPAEVEAVVRQIVEYCRARGVEVVLVTTPVWHTFRENVDPEQQRNFETYTARVVEEYGLRYFNYYASEEFGPDDFHDVDHLNDQGANHFTTILSKNLLKP